MSKQLGSMAFWRVLLCLALVTSTIGGCQGPTRGAKTEAVGTSGGFPQQVDVQATGPAPTAKQSDASENLPDDEPEYQFIDHTRSGCPRRLLVKGTHILGERVLHAWDDNMPGDTTRRRYTLETQSRKYAIFLEKDGDYVYLNSGAELLGINEIIAEQRFTRQDFNDPDKVDSLLSETARLHGRMAHIPGSSVILRTTRGNDSWWLHGTEKDAAVLRELSKDPQFVFDGNFWNVTVNMFKADGSVDRWKVVGEHDPQVNRNQILNIEIAPLKPARTFSWPFLS